MWLLLYIHKYLKQNRKAKKNPGSLFQWIVKKKYLMFVTFKIEILFSTTLQAHFISCLYWIACSPEVIVHKQQRHFFTLQLILFLYSIEPYAIQFDGIRKNEVIAWGSVHKPQAWKRHKQKSLKPVLCFSWSQLMHHMCFVSKQGILGQLSF